MPDNSGGDETAPSDMNGILYTGKWFRLESVYVLSIWDKVMKCKVSKMKGDIDIESSPCSQFVFSLSTKKASSSQLHIAQSIKSMVLKS